jgi:hypothetical protein
MNDFFRFICFLKRQCSFLNPKKDLKFVSGRNTAGGNRNIESEGYFRNAFS